MGFNNKHLELKVIDGSNLIVPSHRVPIGLYVLASTSHGRWNTAIKPVMADSNVHWDESLPVRGRPLMFPRWLMPIFPSTSKAVHLEIRAAFETTMLGRGELVGSVETTFKELLSQDKEFEIPFPATDTQGLSSLLLKAQFVKVERPVDHGATKPSGVDRITDEAYEAYTLYRKSNRLSDYNRAIRRFQAVVDQCPVGNSHRAAALSNLAHAILHGFTKGMDADINYSISLFNEALALCPRGHPDHPLSIYNLCQAHHQRYSHRHDHTDLRKVIQFYHELLPICLKGSYLQCRVIEECNALPRDSSDESTSLRRMVHDLRPSGHDGDGEQNGGNTNDICRTTHRSRDTLSLCSLDRPTHQKPPDKDVDLAKHDPTSVNSKTTPLPGQLREGHLEPERNPLGPERGIPLSSEPQIKSRARNVIIFGETDSGKSSLINAITRSRCARVSNNAAACTLRHEAYEVKLSGREFVLFDTAGFNEGTLETNKADKATKDLKDLVRRLMNPKSNEIDLLVYCVRKGRAKHALARHYNLMYSEFCQKKVPIVLAITGLEDQSPSMDSWWETNKEQFSKLGMHFQDHACVTALSEEAPVQRIKESREVLRSLILNNCPQ